MKVDTKQRLAALRAKMREHGADLVAVGPGSHMDWLLGFHPHPDERPCLLLVGRDEGDIPDARAQCRRLARGDGHRIP